MDPHTPTGETSLAQDTAGQKAAGSAQDDNAPPSSGGTGQQDGREPSTLEEAISAAFGGPDSDGGIGGAGAGATDPAHSVGDDGTANTEADAEAEAEAGADAEAEAEAEAEADADAGAEAGSRAEADADADADPSEAELAALRPKHRRRVIKLLAQRNEARRELEAARKDAEAYGAIRAYMRENDLADAEVAELFQLGADLKSGDPTRLARFLERVRPILQSVMERTGHSLPADLQSQVDDGELPEQAARQLAEARAAQSFAQRQAEQATVAAQQAARAAVAQQVQQAVSAWQAQARQADPDFDLKADAMRRFAQAMVAERGIPRSPAEAVEYAKAAHAEATRFLTAARPAPRASRPAPAAQTAPRSGLAPVPTSLEAIIEQALRG